MYGKCLCYLGLALLVLEIVTPVSASAHSAKQLDLNGCHDDRRRGQYHCHLGEYRGLKFSTEGDFRQQVAAGKTPAQMRQEQGIAEAPDQKDGDDDEGWLSRLHIPFIGGSSSGPRDVGAGEVIMPRGIEERLRTLKDLHEKGLIADDEYTAKRKEILGEL